MSTNTTDTIAPAAATAVSGCPASGAADRIGKAIRP